MTKKYKNEKKIFLEGGCHDKAKYSTSIFYFFHYYYDYFLSELNYVS
jgi:hypothetical protein